MNSFTFQIVEVQGDVRLDQYLNQKLSESNPSEYSRNQISLSIKEGFCKVNGEVQTKPKYIVKNSDHISIEIYSPKSDIKPDPNVKFNIVFEDEAILVISKPRGLIVHPAPGVNESTLVHGLYGVLQNEDLDEDDEKERLGIVHRLDKDTSGLMVVAKTMAAKRNLQEQLQPPRKMKRIYHAIVYGETRNKRGIKEIYSDNGTLLSIEINAPLARDPRNRTKYKVEFSKSNFKIRDALTRCKVISSNGKFHLVECELETGRTHQIRVHFEYLELFVVGDPVYSKRIDRSAFKNYPLAESQSGQLLHAKYLSFIHPLTNERIEFADDYPEDFLKVQNELGLR